MDGILNRSTTRISTCEGMRRYRNWLSGEVTLMQTAWFQWSIMYSPLLCGHALGSLWDHPALESANYGPKTLQTVIQLILSFSDFIEYFVSSVRKATKTAFIKSNQNKAKHKPLHIFYWHTDACHETIEKYRMSMSYIWQPRLVVVNLWITCLSRLFISLTSPKDLPSLAQALASLRYCIWVSNWHMHLYLSCSIISWTLLILSRHCLEIMSCILKFIL